MLLSSNSENRWDDDNAKTRKYNLVMSTEEYQKVLAGETLTHQTASADISGTWIVKFKKNSKKRHKQLIGA